MTTTKKIRIALVWSQFAPHHLDRAEAAAERLGARAEVVAVEVASNSLTYRNWTRPDQPRSAAIATLFPGKTFDHLSRARRLWALLGSLWPFDLVCLAIGYDHYETLVLTVLLRLRGARVVLMTDSKFDDYPRSVSFEFVKKIAVQCYSGVIVGSARGAEYMRFLGFRDRPVLLGVDAVSLVRIRGDAAAHTALSAVPFSKRSFVYVGRFVEQKNLAMVLAAHADHIAMSGAAARDLILVGSGDLEPQLRQQVTEAGQTHKVHFAGFCAGAELAGYLCSGLALILASRREQWGLVVNEALALGLPVIASEAVGARDALVRNLINGVVIENGSRESLTAAMNLIAADEARWHAMSAASHARAWLGDVGPFADSIELLVDPGASGASERMAHYLQVLKEIEGGPRR